MPAPNLSHPDPDPNDVQTNKAIAALAYIVFFLPLLVARESRFAMYHANQGLALFLTALAVNMVLSIIPIIGWLLSPLANFAVIGFAVLGIIHAAKGEIKPLPLIGGISIFK